MKGITMILQICLIAAALAAIGFNFRRDLMMFQQNSYRLDRYMRWFKQSHESTSAMRIWSAIALLAVLAWIVPEVIGAAVAAVICIVEVSHLSRAVYKKPLVWTKRATRIYLTAAVAAVAIIGGAAVAAGLTLDCGAMTAGVGSWLWGAGVAALAINLVSPLGIIAANEILKPVERHITKRYYDEAASIIGSMPDLKIIGVTGSYGKTSTKHYLNRILSEKYDVVMTPGSYNTTLGVVRTIRELVKPYNEVFIVEMGAKQPGDIKEICDLVHPTIGIVTAVGEQHLESFKTIDNIQRTKFELVDALPPDGLAVVNDDFSKSAERRVDNTRCVRYGVRNVGNADYRATDIVTDPTGTTFTIEGRDVKLRLHTRLVGECNVSNLLGAVAVALHLGVDTQKIAYAVENIEQVEHRLNMKRTPGGVTIIDDAFNSNPTGSGMALDVLAAMKGGRRILVTPGMIELGDRQYELNRELGRKGAHSCDIAIVVGEYNREAITEGLQEGGMDKESVWIADSFGEAQRMLAQTLRSGDTVLYENDLPDTFK